MLNSVSIFLTNSMRDSSVSGCSGIYKCTDMAFSLVLIAHICKSCTPATLGHERKKLFTASEDIPRGTASMIKLKLSATPMIAWPKHHGHEEAGVAIIEALCDRLRIPNEYRSLAVAVSRFHLTIHRLFELRANTAVKVLERTDAFRRPQLFNNLLLACQADAEGCGRLITYQQTKLWTRLLAECVKVSPQELIAQGYEGIAIKEALHQRRVAIIEPLLNSWKINEK